MQARMKFMVALVALNLLSACYGDMQFGKEEPSEDEADEAWWCKYRGTCEAKEADTWW